MIVINVKVAEYDDSKEYETTFYSNKLLDPNQKDARLKRQRVLDDIRRHIEHFFTIHPYAPSCHFTFLDHDAKTKGKFEHTMNFRHPGDLPRKFIRSGRHLMATVTKFLANESFARYEAPETTSQRRR